ncbi:CBD9-like protein [Mycena indigotica]|uniref:CBD9-like protein n=1 Tax=Mycena indigotica TaxID=2126181 RepID=A0A8H6TFU1_9AGAR|nr:CBD9-like protein [Mycena indigotica]KAF7315967.1 CBD9-like protein [Mycena indigotica]
MVHLLPVATFSILFALSTASHLVDIYPRDATGDSKCSTYMCVSAILNGSTVQYTLAGTGRATPGWMGVGFGTQMSNTPMVIMWSNSDGSITISQRKAPSEVMPTVDSNPPRLATLSTSLSTTSGNSAFVFTVDSNGANTQSLIFGFGDKNPGDKSASATLQQHKDYGITQLNLQKALSGTGTTTGGGASQTGTPGSSGNTGNEDTGGVTSDIPLTPYQRMIIAHAIFCVLGFALFLPLGALVARYLRTFSSTWYTAHWIAQFVLAGLSIIIGVVLGFKAASHDGSISYKILDDHKKTGIVLFVLYFAQCALGAFIHWVKPKRVLRRPPQNYVHALLGLAIIGLALYQIRTGIKKEWLFTGLDALPSGVYTLWIVWCVVLPVLYAVGLVFLRKQYGQEADARSRWNNEYGMNKGPLASEYHDN